MTRHARREKTAEVRAEQKWDYINLSDFKSTTCFTPLSYGILYISFIISVAVYGVDIFTAANLLFFNRWSGQVKPVIPFHISRWIFAACILLSWILLVYRWVRAMRAMRTGIVAASYLDPLAVRIQSIRVGDNGRGWRRFLVFAELTKGRKGAEYVALFTYFSFEAWTRIVFAEGPRQVINALTLYSVMQANLVPVGEHAPKKGGSPAAQFFINVRILADHNKEQAAILFGMLFTLVVWAFAALGLILAALCYILFLWHYIPSADDGLSGYCRRKVDSRLHKIVGVKVKKALAIEFSPRSGSGLKAIRNGVPTRVTRQPTLPILGIDADDKQKEPPLSRRTAESTLPLNTSSYTVEDSGRLNKKMELTVPYMPPFPNRPMHSSRTVTNSSARSNTSYASNAPLLEGAGEMGYGPSPGSLSTITTPGASSARQNPAPTERNLANSSNDRHRAQDTASKLPRLPFRNSPGSVSAGTPGPQTPWRSDFGFSNKPFQSTTEDYFGAVPEVSLLDRSGRRGSASSEHQCRGAQEYEMQHPRPSDEIGQCRSRDNYVAFNPRLHTQPVPPPTEPFPRKPIMAPMRNFTMPFSRPPAGSASHLAQKQLQQQQTFPRPSNSVPIPTAFTPPPTSQTRNPYPPHSNPQSFGSSSSSSSRPLFVFSNASEFSDSRPRRGSNISSGTTASETVLLIDPYCLGGGFEKTRRKE